jgi:hypothetical protein
MGALRRAEAIINKEFTEAAARAEERLRPLLLAELKELRKVLPVLIVGESLGGTVVTFGGALKGTCVDAVRWGELPDGVTQAAREQFEEFMQLLTRVSDERQAYCLYRPLKATDVSSSNSKKGI